MTPSPTASRERIASAALVACALLLGSFAVAGDLEPPGPPAPTMKKLDQVEPRVAIHATDLPLSITVSGSYYLAESIAGPSGGIGIFTDNVTIDLNGFSLTGGSNMAIYTSPSRKNIIVRNGTIAGWSSVGISLNADNTLVEDVIVESNGVGGILVGKAAIVRDSVATDNWGTGISTADDSQIVNCVAYGNQGTGVRAGPDSIVVNVVARNNTGTGIYALAGSLVRDSVTQNNGTAGIVASDQTTVIDSIARGNGSHGIQVAKQGTVRGCTAAENTGNGIVAGEASVIVGNLADGNGFDTGDGAGIFTSSRFSRIEGNNVTNNDRGIEVNPFGYNLIIRNTARNPGGINFSIAALNSVGPIGALGASTDPRANIEY